MRTRRRWRESWEEFSFLHNVPWSLEWVCPEIGTEGRQNTVLLAVSGALPSALENPGELFDSRAGPYRYPQQVSKVNSL